MEATKSRQVPKLLTRGRRNITHTAFRHPSLREHLFAYNFIFNVNVDDLKVFVSNKVHGASSDRRKSPLKLDGQPHKTASPPSPQQQIYFRFLDVAVNFPASF